MKTICKRLLSLLLVFVLVLGLMPSVYAATDAGTSPTTETATAETIAPPETVADETTPITENTEATEATEPSEATEPPETTDATQPPAESDEESEETQSTEAAKPDNVPLMMAANNDGIMLAASTQNSIMLFDFADNGNYTSSLNSQITVKYKWNGTGSSLYCYLKNFGWHFARYGKLKIVKTMPSGGPLAGWEFIIRDKYGSEIEDSPFVTDDTGLIVSENILPGEYTVEEQIPEGSPYLCISENPQTITVTQGETAEVSFTNVLSEGKISIKKVDTAGESLAGAEFLLEWSKDGTNWMPVVRTDSEYPREGTCSSPGISDAKLTSGEDGIVTFEGLYPVSQYRLTETKAPEGFQLLKDTAFEGSIPIGEEMIVELTVVNVRIFEMPETGSKSLILMPVSLALACGLCAAFLFLNKRNKR